MLVILRANGCYQLLTVVQPYVCTLYCFITGGCSYYLNSHHVDFQEWAMQGKARPVRVTATASTGVAHAKDINTEDAITLMVQWQVCTHCACSHYLDATTYTHA
jgi:hypothetical protein